MIQLHFGGGTPNFLSPAQLRERRGLACAGISISRDSHERDLSIELDPRFISPADVAELAAIGFNRASLGVQDFDPAGAGGGQPHPVRRGDPRRDRRLPRATASARSTST